MSSYISIELNNPSNSYIPGSTLTGNVIIFLTQPKKARNITLFSCGEERTSFHYQSVLPCASQKIFFEYYFLLWKPANGGSEIITAGKQTFKFSFKIPSNCLPNFEGDYGHVRYSIKAKMAMAFNFDFKCEKSFVVKSVIPSAVIAKQVKQNFIHKFPDPNQRVNIEFTIPKERFIVGETIYLLANINNLTKASIDSLETGIQTKITYKGKATDSWRGKYFEAVETETLNSFSKKNKLFVNGGQNYCYKRNFELEKVYPSINDDLISVKHCLYIKLFVKKISTVPMTFVVPIKVYTAAHRSDETSNITFIPTQSASSRINTSSANGNHSNAISRALNDPPPAYSEVDSVKTFNFVIPLKPMHPPKYENLNVQNF